MRLNARLHLRQAQSLVMTPQLMQSIRLLQLSHGELERFIEEEIERNPLLDHAEPPEDASSSATERPEELPAEVSTEGDWPEGEGDWTAQEMSARLDTSLENIFPDDPGVPDRLGPDLAAQWKSAAGNSGVQPADGFEPVDLAATPVSLRDHVGEQIVFAFPDPAARLVARELADNLDDDGYIRADLAEIAARLGSDMREIDAALAVCQTFEPTGLFARDLAECLSLQLAQQDRLDPAMRALIGNLDLLARRDFASLKRICGVEEEDLLDMLAEIRALDPRPGTRFSSGTIDAIVADVEVRPARDGSWTVELNPETLPRVLVDNAYFARVSSRTSDREEKDFLSECLQNANWLARSLDQRAKTILKVASEIVRRQDDFLAHGIRHLKPLNLRGVADAIGMHESTVSRAAANKYMLTPRGVFELRYFFTTSIAASDEGEAHSSEAVRDRIRELIEAEKPSQVHSDDALVDMLRKSGIEIARRTVAKYRENMNIPSSVQRRREKRAMLAAGR